MMMPPTQCHLTFFVSGRKTSEVKSYTKMSLFTCFYSLELFCLPGNILGFHFAIARTSNDFHSRNMIFFCVSLLHMYYERNAFCAMAEIQYYWKLQYAVKLCSYSCSTNAGGLVWSSFFCFFWSCSGGLLLWRHKRYLAWALFLESFLKWDKKKDTFSCGINSVAIVFNSLTSRISFCWYFCLFRTRLPLMLFTVEVPTCFKKMPFSTPTDQHTHTKIHIQ